MAIIDLGKLGANRKSTIAGGFPFQKIWSYAWLIVSTRQVMASAMLPNLAQSSG